MATFEHFEDIEAWRRARELTRQVYAVTKRGPFARDFGLRDQICRASVSIMSNIAEGFERSGRAEFLQFLATAKGSAGEVRAQFYVALDEGYLDQDSFGSLSEMTAEVGRLIGGLMNYLRTTSIKGTKYR